MNTKLLLQAFRLLVVLIPASPILAQSPSLAGEVQNAVQTHALARNQLKEWLRDNPQAELIDLPMSTLNIDPKDVIDPASLSLLSASASTTSGSINIPLSPTEVGIRSARDEQTPPKNSPPQIGQIRNVMTGQNIQALNQAANSINWYGQQGVALMGSDITLGANVDADGRLRLHTTLNADVDMRITASRPSLNGAPIPSLWDVAGLWDAVSKGVNKALDEEREGDSGFLTWAKATTYAVVENSVVVGLGREIGRRAEDVATDAESGGFFGGYLSVVGNVTGLVFDLAYGATIGTLEGTGKLIGTAAEALTRPYDLHEKEILAQQMEYRAMQHRIAARSGATEAETDADPWATSGTIEFVVADPDRAAQARQQQEMQLALREQQSRQQIDQRQQQESAIREAQIIASRQAIQEGLQALAAGSAATMQQIQEFNQAAEQQRQAQNQRMEDVVADINNRYESRPGLSISDPNDPYPTLDPFAGTFESRPGLSISDPNPTLDPFTDSFEQQGNPLANNPAQTRGNEQDNQTFAINSNPALDVQTAFSSTSAPWGQSNNTSNTAFGQSCRYDGFPVYRITARPENEPGRYWEFKDIWAGDSNCYLPQCEHCEEDRPQVCGITFRYHLDRVNGEQSFDAWLREKTEWGAELLIIQSWFGGDIPDTTCPIN